MKKVMVFINNDLDGAGSLMVLKWALEGVCDVDYAVSTIFSVNREYNSLVNSARGDDYSKIFILNMVPDFEVLPTTAIFSKGDAVVLSINGKIGVSSSSTLLLRTFFHNRLTHLTPNQTRLLDVIDDFFTDGDISQDSIKLNAVFSYGRNKFTTFNDRFYEGLSEYTVGEKDIIKYYVQGLIREYKAISLGEHTKHKGMFIVLVSSMRYKHELLDMIFKNNNPNMVFLVDGSGGFVSVRKQDSHNFDMQKLINTFIDGRALVNCAGGRFTEKFIDFTKSFG